METIINIQYTAMLILISAYFIAVFDLAPKGNPRYVWGVTFTVSALVAFVTTLIRIWG